MNVDNQTILHIKAGHLPPKQLLELLIGKKPTAFGFAVQEDAGADMQTVQEDGENLEMDNLEQFSEGRKERPTTLYFGNLKKPYDGEDIQPYTLKDGDGNTFLSLFSEGDIVNHDNPASHTEHYNFVVGTVLPKIIEWCNDFDGDIEKIMAKINGDVFKKDVLSHIGHRGLLHILPFKGAAATISQNVFGDNTLGREFDWGWISMSHGFGEEVKATAEPAKKGGWGYGPKKIVEAVKSAVTTKQNPPGVHNVGDTVKDKPQDAATAGTHDRSKDKAPEIAVKPPAWLLKNNDVQDFYKIVSGKSHPGWKRRLPAVITQNHSVLQCKNLDEFNAWRLQNFKDGTAAMTSNTQTKQERLSSSQQDETHKTTTQPERSVPNNPDDLPIIEPKELERVLDFIAKHLDGNSKEIMPPQEMQKTEAALPKFSDATGTKLEEMLNWPVSGLFGIAGVDPRAMVLYALQWRSYARPYLLAEMKAKNKDGVKMTTETVTKTEKLGDNTTKTESVVKQVPVKEAAPAAKKGWGYGGNKKVA